MKWVQRPRSADEKDTKRETVYTVRLKYILVLLSKNPEWKTNFIETLSVLLMKISSPMQFSKMGFSSQGFMQEFIHRLQEKILPKNPLTDDLETLMDEIFPDEDESLYVSYIDDQVLREFFDLFSGRADLHLKLKKDLLSATNVLCTQLLNGVFAIRQELNYSDRDLENFPEFQLLGILHKHQMDGQPVLDEEVFKFLDLIEKNTEDLYSAMQTQGVKIELVYLFQMQRRKLRRLNNLAWFLREDANAALNFRIFVSQMILDTYHQKSFRSFFSENLSLLTQRIVQANSDIGEHYVTYTWQEFRKMYQSAAGGGAVTALTVFLKMALAKLGFAGFVKGLSESLNYSGSFLLIQIAGFTLATKQPSTTAPFIAAELQKSTREARKSIVALLRTQFIAVLGNLSTVFPICFLISAGFSYFGYPLMPVNQAIETFSSTNAVGPSILFATFTGGLLFLASLLAGWIENWIIVNQISKRIRYNEKLGHWLGSERTKRLAQFISDNSNALGGNIVLGFLLGMTPQVLKFLGLGLDVRHVTLATGAFATALPIILNIGLESWTLVNAVIGIFLIGFINISVSFVLAFLLASISSNVKVSSFLKLFRSGLRLILMRPWLLLVPEKK